MKLKPEFDKFQELFNKGFRFDPENHVFFTSNPETFQKPEGFEEWEIQAFDRNEYLNKRLEELGISQEENEIELIDDLLNRSSSRGAFPVFTANKNGDIEIIQYTLDRKVLRFQRKNSQNPDHTEIHAQVRLNPLYADFCEGKYDFSEAKNTPFWHKSLIEKFEAGDVVDTLVITEGQIKAFKAAMTGIDCVGLTSISHFKDKSTGKIHTEIIEFIRKCNVRKLVILWDADCRDISLKQLEAGKDISKRPHLFYSFACSIREMVQEFFPAKRLEVFFATIKEFESDVKPKGIDDLLLIKGFAPAVVQDFQQIGEIPGRYIYSENITQEMGVKKLRKYFKLHSVKEFYDFHSDKINGKPFIFFNSNYRVENSVPLIEVSSDLKVYKLIGTNYYKLIQSPFPTGKKGDTMTETVLEPWTENIIKLVHGKDSIKQIERFEGFTNIASHTDYRAVIDNHWNLYYDVQHTKEEGDFPTIKKLLKHLFEEHYDNEMILDYITILYRYPMQKLPVICLVSKEQGTGKSTFLYLLKLLFKQNMTIISNNELTADFNAHWVSKLIVASEETLLEKKDGYEKIKSISTAKYISRNEKNKTAKDIPCMCHFVFCSNHEDDFIRINDYDSRLWIRKIKPFTEKIRGFDSMLEREIPAFVNFLEQREIVYQENDRLWFAPMDFRTKAFNDLVANSVPGIVKEMQIQLIESFMKFGGKDRLMTAQDFKQYFGIKSEVNYLNKLIKQYFKATRLTNANGIEYVTTYQFPVDDQSNPGEAKYIKSKGRPFVISAEHVLSKIDYMQLESNLFRAKTDDNSNVQNDLPF